MYSSALPTSVQQDDLLCPANSVEFNLQEVTSMIVPSLRDLLETIKTPSRTRSQHIKSVVLQMIKSLDSDNAGSNSSEYTTSGSADGKCQVQNILSYLGYLEMASMLHGRKNPKDLLREPGVSLTLEVIRAVFIHEVESGDSSKIFAMNHLRYLTIGALADKLTYPCSITYFFHHMILALFHEPLIRIDQNQSDTLRNEKAYDTDFVGEKIKEVIARVLLERLIVHRPHPWGIMVTFIELVKNPIYKFWDYEFTRATPDIERVFQAILHNCIGSDNSISTESSAYGEQATSRISSNITL